ncbi:MAG TPA: protein jag [Anaerolineae bacterium]|nr:protein jag [Anaerolineae bacterium]
MSKLNQESVKSSAKTVEAAIDQALEQLNLSRDQVDVEIISEGKSGIFGLGAEDAQVLVTPKAPDAGDDTPVLDSAAETAVEAAEEIINKSKVSATRETAADSDLIDPALQERAGEILQEILTRMSITADVSARIGKDLVDPGERPPLTLDITGADLGLLIGRKGETLRALQFVMRQILSKEAGRWVPVVVDVESYLVRRRKSLQQLADRMADRVVFSGRKVALEPMPAQERRIVHIQLRNHQHVYTNSVGEGERRKVVILPK